MMMLKTKKVILTGKKQRLLHEEVYQRDGGCCAICGAPVPEGVKAHHEPPKSQDCHAQRHFNAPREYKAKCREYLEGLYGKC